MKKLLHVKNSNRSSQAILIDLSLPLSEARIKLISLGVMQDSDFFLFESSNLTKDQESEILVEDIVDGNCIEVGEGVHEQVLLGGNFELMLNSDKLALFNELVVHGYSPTSDMKMSRSANSIMVLNDRISPKSHTPDVNTEIAIESYYNKLAYEVASTGIQSTSLSMKYEVVSGEAQFKSEKSKTSSGSSITEYMLARYVVRRASFNIDQNSYTLSTLFIEKLREAIEGQVNDITKCCNILRTLNAWGYYIPTKFSFGGVLYCHDQKSIDEYSESTKNKETFKSEFKGSFEKIGGGAAYESSVETTSSKSESSKTASNLIYQIGGKAGASISTTDYSAWAESLEEGSNWALCDITEMRSTLACVESIDATLFSKCVALIDGNASHKDAVSVQSQIDLKKYVDLLQQESHCYSLYD